MPKFEADEYRSVEEFRLAIQVFHGFAGLLLFAFAKQECETKDVLIRNFVARTDTMLRGVLQLWEIDDFQDCWILNRCLLDRLFHLVHLGETGEYELFDDWSFVEQYKAQNRVRSDSDFSGAQRSEFFTPSPKEKARFLELSSAPPNWTRPKAESVAKEMNLSFLYKYGYEFGSTHVHPMANDGQEDFFRITKREPAHRFPDQLSVLSNSILVSCLITQEALNQSSFRWRRPTYEFLSQLVNHIRDGGPDYQASFLKLAEMARSIDLCEPRRPGPREGAT